MRVHNPKPLPKNHPDSMKIPKNQHSKRRNVPTRPITAAPAVLNQNVPPSHAYVKHEDELAKTVHLFVVRISQVLRIALLTCRNI